VNSTWRRNVLLPLAVCGMEAAWLLPALQSVGAPFRGGQPVIAPELAAALLLLGAFAGRFFLKGNQGGDARIPMAVLLVGSGVGVVWWEHYATTVAFYNPAWVGDFVGGALGLFGRRLAVAGTLVALVMVWQRALALARSDLSFDDVQGYFRAAVLMYIALHLASMLFSPLGFPHFPVAAMTINGVLLFSCGLVAMAVARVEAAADARSVSDLAQNGQWAGVLAAAVFAEIALALVVLAVLSADVGALLAAPLALAANGLLWVAMGVLLGIAYGVSWILFAFQWLMQAFGLTPSLQQLTPPDFSALEDLRDPEKATQLFSPEVLLSIKALLLALGAVAMVAVLVWGLRRRRHSVRRDGDVVRESVFSWAGARADLRALWDLLWGRLLRRGNLAVSALTDRLPDVGERDDVPSFREAYRRLLRNARRSGLPRPAETTPHEWLAVWSRTRPAALPDLAAVTEGYERERYGERPADAAAATAAWRRTREALQRAESE